MFGDKIEDLENLLKDHIGASKTIVDSKITRLTGPGENYGGTLLKLDITLKSKNNGKQEELYIVAKLIPEDEFFRKMFNVQTSCKVEIAFYDIVVPTLQDFQRRKGVQQVMDFFPKKCGGRINLNGSDVVDENAVLAMENLVAQGYQNVNRLESFDLPTTKLILKDLAAYHAVPLALKLLEPETFATKIKPNIGHAFEPPPKEDRHEGPNEMLFKLLEHDEDCKTILPLLKEKGMGPPTPIRNEPFVTMGHGDLWVNNIMVKFEEGKPVDSKFVDFQYPTYTSPAVDLFFLLWSSVKMEVLEEHLDDLIRFYHEEFVENLRQVGCDASQFSLDRLLEEIKGACENEVLHVLFFSTMVVFYEKEPGGEFKLPHERTAEDVPEIAKKRIIHMVKACKNKGWL